ncbi:uncharacterized protein TRIADDRAFT_51800 [Trichoplax adhaerens]|uniref:Uncharacterized protein n=1 Tax=Trichoplax adhaerens TaxID=10228 RepID=B3RKX5_TRIAD|nr:predicted protein [Trichoplax adhaerens]EDV29451.1 predicted protein [Trichoplax adhaerens]|eukprot:XP_002108653.1 predicted protein [Trichoplax adhaerens]
MPEFNCYLYYIVHVYVLSCMLCNPAFTRNSLDAAKAEIEAVVVIMQRKASGKCVNIKEVTHKSMQRNGEATANHRSIPSTHWCKLIFINSNTPQRAPSKS